MSSQSQSQPLRAGWEVAPRFPPSALQRPLLLQRGRLPRKGKWQEPTGGKGSNTDWDHFFSKKESSEEAPGGGDHEDKDPASVSPVSPQVQVLLYYLQHPPISFAELKRNTLYFSTDV